MLRNVRLLTIQRPLANAVNAREMTKFGKIDDISTTRDSPARRSRNSHITQVKKALPPGRRLIRKYVIIENKREMRTAGRQQIKPKSQSTRAELRT